jgi:O-antigen/teichoic acid export membrane protein
MGATIKSRFAVSFIANMARSGVTVATGILLARWLGPVDFGRMSFLFAAFTAIRGMLDMGSSTAFFTLLSRRPRSRQFIAIFWSFIGFQLCLSLLLLLVLLPQSVINALWAGESRLYLGLAFLAAFMQGTVWTLAVQMAEANRQTIKAQKINTAVVLLHLLVVFALALGGKLAIPLVFAASIIEWAAAAWLVSRLYSVNAEGAPAVQATEADTPKSVFWEFFHYCLPLVPMTFLGFVHDFADRWMLQTWAGAKEQAYFSVAQQYSAVALLATVSVLRILWKEIAEAHHQGDVQRVGMLYKRASRLLFFVGAFMAGALQPLAAEILRFTVGDAYLSGALGLGIMLMYPIHQSLGQICGTMSFATGHTKVYAWSSSVSMLVSLIVAYFVLAPVNAPVPGLHLGAEGLALKLVCMQVFSVNLVAWGIAKVFGWRFDWEYQLFALAGCVGIGWLSHWMAYQALGTGSLLMFRIGLMALLYTVFVGIYVYLFPWMIAMTRGELAHHVARLQGLPGIKKLT